MDQRYSLQYPFRMNTIYCGDCLEVLRDFPDECVDLIYLDPPFFTSKDYEIVFDDSYEIRGFKDAHWYDESGKRRNDLFVYLDWLRERVRESYRILKSTGLLYLHCDYHANSYIRVYILDEIFGRGNFRNEIVYCYSGGGIPKKDFPRKHDTIYRYSKSDDYYYRPIFRPYSEGTIERGRTKVKGEYYERGLREEGTPLTDWWTDVKYIHSPTDFEKLGYPTQKSEELLEMIVKTSSNLQDIVLDPMCGCGTALVAAHRLARRWIGIDISPTGCRLMLDRLRKNFDGFRVSPPSIIGLPLSIAELKKISWFDFQNWVCQRINGRSAERRVRDQGIDGWTFEGIPIQVKQSENVGRPTVDKFETALRRFYSVSRKEEKGIIIAFSFSSDAYNEASRAKIENGMDIQLKTVSEILKP